MGFPKEAVVETSGVDCQPMNDDEGVLGRLPRSRPGTRSEKREGSAEPQESAPEKSRPATGTARAAKSSERRGTKASRPAKGASAGPRKRASARPAAANAQAAEPPPPQSAASERDQGGNPVAGAVRAGARVAEGGVKLAGGLARGLLRKLPRP